MPIDNEPGFGVVPAMKSLFGFRFRKGQGPRQPQPAHPDFDLLERDDEILSPDPERAESHCLPAESEPGINSSMDVPHPDFDLSDWQAFAAYEDDPDLASVQDDPPGTSTETIPPVVSILSPPIPPEQIVRLYPEGGAPLDAADEGSSVAPSTVPGAFEDLDIASDGEDPGGWDAEPAADEAFAPDLELDFGAMPEDTAGIDFDPLLGFFEDIAQCDGSADDDSDPGQWLDDALLPDPADLAWAQQENPVDASRFEGIAAHLVMCVDRLLSSQRRPYHRRLLAIVEDFPYASSHLALERMLIAGVPLSMVEECAALKLQWRDSPWLWCQRRTNRLLGGWQIETNASLRNQLSWKASIALVETEGLFEAQHAIEADWLTQWRGLQRETIVDDRQAEGAFFSYPFFLGWRGRDFTFEDADQWFYEEAADRRPAAELVALYPNGEPCWQFERKTHLVETARLELMSLAARKAKAAADTAAAAATEAARAEAAAEKARLAAEAEREKRRLARALKRATQEQKEDTSA